MSLLAILSESMHVIPLPQTRGCDLRFLKKSVGRPGQGEPVFMWEPINVGPQPHCSDLPWEAGRQAGRQECIVGGEVLPQVSIQKRLQVVGPELEAHVSQGEQH